MLLSFQTVSTIIGRPSALSVTIRMSSGGFSRFRLGRGAGSRINDTGCRDIGRLSRWRFLINITAKWNAARCQIDHNSNWTIADEQFPCSRPSATRVYGSGGILWRSRGLRRGVPCRRPVLLTEMPFPRSKDRMCLNHCALTAASIVRIWSRLTALSNEERAVLCLLPRFSMTLLILSLSAPVIPRVPSTNTVASVD